MIPEMLFPEATQEDPAVLRARHGADGHEDPAACREDLGVCGRMIQRGSWEGEFRWGFIIYLVGGFKHCLFSIIYGIVFPID